MAANPRILHLFNRYRFPGGEETAVLRMREVMRAQGAAVEELFISSNDWDGPAAPPQWQQPMRALIHEPGDAVSLAKDILEFYQQPLATAAMGHAGQEWLLANTSAEHWWQGFMNIRVSFKSSGVLA